MSCPGQCRGINEDTWPNTGGTGKLLREHPHAVLPTPIKRKLLPLCAKSDSQRARARRPPVSCRDEHRFNHLRFKLRCHLVAAVCGDKHLSNRSHRLLTRNDRFPSRVPDLHRILRCLRSLHLLLASPHYTLQRVEASSSNRILGASHFADTLPGRHHSQQTVGILAVLLDSRNSTIPVHI